MLVDIEHDEPHLSAGVSPGELEHEAGLADLAWPEDGRPARCVAHQGIDDPLELGQLGGAVVEVAGGDRRVRSEHGIR